MTDYQSSPSQKKKGKNKKRKKIKKMANKKTWPKCETKKI